MKKARLIINADDFGLTAGVNKGITETIRNGLVTSTTVMVNMPHAPKILELAREFPHIGVGVHINLTQGKPVSERDLVRSLLREDGEFLGEEDLMKRSFLRKLNLTEVYSEVVAQINRLREWGIQPTHIDSHQRNHLFPGIYPTVLKAALNCRVSKIRTHRRWFVCCNSNDRSGSFLQYHIKSPRKILTWIFSRYRRAFAVRKGFACPDWLISPLEGASLSFTEKFCKAVRALPDGISELVTHPAYNCEELAGYSTYTFQRQNEMDALESKQLKEEIQENGVEMINYGNL